MKTVLRLVSVAFVAMLFLFVSRAVAQLPPPGVSCPPGWLLYVEIFPQVDLGGGCPLVDLEIWFCMPDPNGGITPKEQIVIKAIRKQGGGGFPCPITGTAVREFAESIMFDRNPGGWTVPVSCSQWCLEHPDCPCAALYPQWTAVNGSCGKLVPDGSDMSIVMCGEVDGEGQNCYYSYQVCKRPNGQIWKRWVGKQIQTFCPGLGMSSECTIPLCDEVGKPEEPSGEGCPDPPPATVPSNPSLSSVEKANDGNSGTTETTAKTNPDVGTEEGNE